MAFFLSATFGELFIKVNADFFSRMLVLKSSIQGKFCKSLCFHSSLSLRDRQQKHDSGPEFVDDKLTWRLYFFIARRELLQKPGLPGMMGR